LETVVNFKSGAIEIQKAKIIQAIGLKLYSFLILEKRLEIRN
jgi:hypothetical protein